MNIKMPKIAWNALAVFFLLWFGVCVWLLAGGDTSPVVRFAFALCGGLGVYAGRVGGLFGRVKASPVRFRINGCGAFLLILFAVCGAFVALLTHMANELYTDHFAASRLQEQGYALLTYAHDHKDTLPPDLRSKTVSRYFPIALRMEQPARNGEPFVWNSELAGRRTTAFKKPHEIVLAYTRKISEQKGYVILYLDGHYKKRKSWETLRAELRETSAIIAASKVAARRGTLTVP